MKRAASEKKMSKAGRAPKEERQNELKAMVQTEAGRREIIRIYKRLHGIDEYVSTQSPDLSAGMRFSEMVDRIIAVEYPE